MLMCIKNFIGADQNICRCDLKSKNKVGENNNIVGAINIPAFFNFQKSLVKKGFLFICKNQNILILVFYF